MAGQKTRNRLRRDRNGTSFYLPGSAPVRTRAAKPRRAWLAGDFKAGEFRKRRDALAHCPKGVLPFLVALPSRAEQRVSR